MAIRLSKNLKIIIARQFKSGDSVPYLAGVYGVSQDRIEQVIREKLTEIDRVGENQIDRGRAGELAAL